MVLDGIVFRPGSHSTRLESSKSEGSNIVSVNFDVHVGVFAKETCARKKQENERERSWCHELVKIL
jgi:hypothetical protein